MAGVRSGDWRLADDGTVDVGGVTLQPDEFQLTARARPGHEVAEDGDLLVALDTALDDELAAEGLAREVAHRLQAMRKAAGYEISDRVRVAIAGDGRRHRPRSRHTATGSPTSCWRARCEIGPDAALEAADGDRVGRRSTASALRLSVARA